MGCRSSGDGRDFVKYQGDISFTFLEYFVFSSDIVTFLLVAVMNLLLASFTILNRASLCIPVQKIQDQSRDLLT